MGGLFGVTSSEDCVLDLFYGTDYHSHLGTCRGGMAVRNGQVFTRSIHDITNTPFRTKFEHDILTMSGRTGIGVISDNESQPLIIGSHLGTYAIATVSSISNIDALAGEIFSRGATHFSEMSGGGINPTELVATLINQGASFAEGIAIAQSKIEGSCSMLLLTDHGIYAGRDRLGRTPIIIGAREGAMAATFETTAFPNLGFRTERFLGPGEIVLINAGGIQDKQPPGDELRICAFLWIYYGFPGSSYEGINVETVRNRCGRALARRDDVQPDLVAGIPDSGIGHAIGYASESGIKYRRPFAKYTPTWPRSFTPQDQRLRDLVARMKLIPIREYIEGRSILFCEDSIVRGTQLTDTIGRLRDLGAREIHMRSACPPLLWICPYLSFSRSRSMMELASRKAISALEGDPEARLEQYADPDSDHHRAMVEEIGRRLGLTTLRYQRLEDMVEAIGLPRDKLCTYCWTGCAGGCCAPAAGDGGSEAAR